MSDNKELIRAVSLLNQALVMLVNEYYSKEKYIESLKKPRSDLSKDFQDFLLHKNEKELAGIMDFVCRCEQFIDVKECQEEEKEELTDIQKKALKLILENERVCGKVAKLADEAEEAKKKQEVTPNE